MIFADELYWWQAKNNMDERKYALLCFWRGNGRGRRGCSRRRARREWLVTASARSSKRQTPKLRKSLQNCTLIEYYSMSEGDPQFLWKICEGFRRIHCEILKCHILVTSTGLPRRGLQTREPASGIRVIFPPGGANVNSRWTCKWGREMCQPGSKGMSSGEWNTKLFPVYKVCTTNTSQKIILISKLPQKSPDSNCSKDEMADIKESRVDWGETL